MIATLTPGSGQRRGSGRRSYRRWPARWVETVETSASGRAGTVRARQARARGAAFLHWKRETEERSGCSTGSAPGFARRTTGARRGARSVSPAGGAIPLEGDAARVGEVTAVDLNPVAWFILKCTLDYPRGLAGETRPLPAFALRDRDFMAAFLKTQGVKGRALTRELAALGLGDDGETAEPKLLDPRPAPEADLAWQVRAWGRRALAETRRLLARRYPTYAAAFRGAGSRAAGRSSRGRRLTAGPDADGNVDGGPLNAAFDCGLSEGRAESGWVAKTDGRVSVGAHRALQGSRATIPLLKTCGSRRRAPSECC